MAGGKKVVIVGDERTGKTALCLVYCRAPFPTTHFTTVSDTYARSGCTLELADTAGSYEFDRLRPFSYDHADAFIIAFSVDDPLSLENVEEKWVPEVRYFSDKVPILLVALKTDLRSEEETVQRLSRESLRPVRFDEGETVAARIGAAKYIECSARDSINVDAVFDAARAILGAGDAQLMTPAAGGVSAAVGARQRRRSSLSIQTPSTAEALVAGGPQLDERMAGPSTPDSETSQPAPSSSESSDSDDDGHQSDSPASPSPPVLPRRTSMGGRSIATASIATANNVDDDAASRRKSLKSVRSAHSAASRRSTGPPSLIKQKSSSIIIAPPPAATPPLKAQEVKPPEPSAPQISQPAKPTKQRSGGCKCSVM
ncbi:hypothetical protein HDU87_001698 [Geranomyces variabilis]|uniref:Uncharacterized protein n=1 Tax=Geranomyces variabilis TaxID=109894 RepID=A0AAD5TGM3_9FUNG|nr:hypothetical protein HDU87_001698 [Geranomyces variabilis]